MEQSDFVLGKGRIIIDSDVVKVLLEKDEQEVVQTMDEINKRLLELSDESYIHVVPANTAAERAHLLPKTDKALGNYEKRDKTGRPLFGVVIGEANGNRPALRAKKLPDSTHPLTLEEIARIERSHIHMSALLKMDGISEFLLYLQSELDLSRERLSLVYKALPHGFTSDRRRHPDKKRRDYLEFLSKIWPQNKELLDAIAAFRKIDDAKSKVRSAERQDLKKWHNMSDSEKIRHIKQDFPQHRWNSTHTTQDLKQFAEDIKGQYGIGQWAFQVFMSSISPELPGEYYTIPGGPSTQLTPGRFHHFYKTLWGSPHPDKQLEILSEDQSL